jgi:hypothetical protein
MPRRSPPTSARTKSWLKADLLFLGLSLLNGMPIGEVAGFLARNEDEVREKAVELRLEARRRMKASNAHPLISRPDDMV